MKTKAWCRKCGAASTYERGWVCMNPSEVGEFEKRIGRVLEVQSLIDSPDVAVQLQLSDHPCVKCGERGMLISGKRMKFGFTMWPKKK